MDPKELEERRRAIEEAADKLKHDVPRITLLNEPNRHQHGDDPLKASFGRIVSVTSACGRTRVPGGSCARQRTSRSGRMLLRGSDRRPRSLGEACGLGSFGDTSPKNALLLIRPGALHGAGRRPPTSLTGYTARPYSSLLSDVRVQMKKWRAHLGAPGRRRRGRARDRRRVEGEPGQGGLHVESTAYEPCCAPSRPQVPFTSRSLEAAVTPVRASANEDRRACAVRH